METIGTAEVHNGLYILRVQLSSSCSSVRNSLVNSVTIPKSELWHYRLAHASNNCTDVIHSQFPFINITKDSICDICHFAKQKKLPFPLSNSKAVTILDLIHIDIWGPFPTPSVHGHKYFLTIVDDHSRFTWLYLMRGKYETSQLVQDFVTLMETQFHKTVKAIRSDNGPEFTLLKFYSSKGILRQTSCAYTPQQNGIVERKHQHIMNVARALMFQSHLPKIYWSHAVAHAVHIINLLPTPLLTNKSPHEVFHQCPPDFSH